MSACLPGLGQAYNKKYWKIPVIYAGLGTFGYFATSLNSNYKKFKNAYIFRYDNDPNTTDLYATLSDAQLKDAQNYYRRYRDLNIIFIAALYTLNIIDANVDANMFTFDVSDNLSMNFEPFFETKTCLPPQGHFRYGRQAFSQLPDMGLSFALKF